MGAGSGEGGLLGYCMAWKPPNTWRRCGGAAAALVLLQVKAAQAMPQHQTAAAAGGKNEACGAPAPLSRHAESSLGTAATRPQALGTRSTIERQEKERKVCAG